MRIAKPLLLVTTPIGLAVGLYEGWRLAGGLVFIMAALMLVIAAAFWGPWKDPVRNLWVIHFGMIACLGILPLAFICGPIRGIPFYWTLIDCAFGCFGILPLWLVRRDILRLAAHDPRWAQEG